MTTFQTPADETVATLNQAVEDSDAIQERYFSDLIKIANDDEGNVTMTSNIIVQS